jgi:Ser/Thr protein kinase RdoA (MazF antagonist)
VSPFEEPVETQDFLWSTCPFLSGKPKAVRDSAELRSRGRLLAELHSDLSLLAPLAPRPGWRRAEQILSDLELDRILAASETAKTEEVRIVRWHLDRSRHRIEGLGLENHASIPVHGDFATWNLLFEDGRLSGILDFELARNDHRVADFTLAWRGKYDEVVEGYEEVSPLTDEERAAIVPIWWAQLIEDACRQLREGENDGGWSITKLLARTPLMGADALELP